MPGRPKLLPAVVTLMAAATMALMGYEMARSAASSIFLAHHSAIRLTEALMLVPLAMVALTLAVSWLLRRVGPSATYGLTLIVSGLLLAASSYAAAALAGAVAPLLPVLGIAFFLSKTVDYSVFRASKEVLYVPLPFTARYRGKLTIDALIYRSTKGVASALLSLAGLAAGVLPLRIYPLLAVFLGGFWNRVSQGLPEPRPTAER